MRKRFGTTIEQGDAAVASLADGVSEVADLVRATMGPMGKNIIIEGLLGYPIITKDGVTVAKSISLADPLLSAGAELCKGVAARTDAVAGDGTTTTVVLVDTMVKSGRKLLAAGYNPVELRAGMNLALKQVLVYLQELSLPADTLERLLAAASVSSKNELTGTLIGEAVDKVGLDGIITVKASQQQKTFVEIAPGMEIDRGYTTPNFISKGAKMTVELDDVFVFITDCAFTEAYQMEKIINWCSFEKKSLLVVANDVRRSSLGVLLDAKNSGAVQTVAVNAPGRGIDRLMILDDIAAATGGETVSEALGSSLDTCKKSVLGRAKRVVVNGTSTCIIQGEGKKEVVEQRIRQLKSLIEQTADSKSKMALKKRLARLSGGIAVIQVGGTTELEMKEAKYRIEDGVNAAQAAAKLGILPGGGKAAWAAAANLQKQAVALQATETSGVCQGYQIVVEGLWSPLKQILANAGLDITKITHDWAEIDFWQGYDVLKKQSVDLLATGIVDPTLVVLTAIRNSVSVASMILTSDVILGEPKFRRSKNSQEADELLGSVESGVNGVTWG